MLWWSVAFVPVSIGSPLRRMILRRFGAEVGSGTLIGTSVRVAGPSGLVIGSRVTISRGSLVDARGGLVIEDAALVGFESILLSWTHRFDDPTIAVLDQGFEGLPIRVGRASWLGARSILLPGVTLGEEAIVGAASVVTRDVGPSVIVAGNPARPIKARLVDP
jgi:putative colanic acid biosynthesis acetyltransferase WcaF